MTKRALLLVLVLSLLGVPMTRSIWSGGVKWGSSSNTGKWMPDGASPSGKPVPDVAVAGALLTGVSVQSASWSSGPADPFDDLAPQGASFTFVGQVTASPGDDVVVSTGNGVMWSGQVDSVQDTLDTAGHHWTTITATDRLGVLGMASLRNAAGYGGDFSTVVTRVASAAGITLSVTDATTGTYTMPQLYQFTDFLSGGNPVYFTGTVLEYINIAARSSNAMVAMQNNGSIKTMLRQHLPSAPSSVTLSGASAPVSWTKTTAAGNNINRWVFTSPNGTAMAQNTIFSDIASNGERSLTVDNELSQVTTHWTEWWANPPVGYRDVVTDGQFVVSDLSQTSLLALNPLDWITVNGETWQVMSMQWSLDAPGEPMRLTITADDFMSLL